MPKCDRLRRLALLALAATLCACAAQAQVFSPRVLVKRQVDSSDLKRLANTICENAAADTPRRKAEAIWRFFLTDGRFVAPGFWYHIAGWAYEEPDGEVLDPLRLLNSYGFGLCYHLAPLLEAVFEAAGFEDARVWFLTGHTVTEVFYDGAYHYYDSDMMGYSTIGAGDPKTLPVASVSQIASDGTILLGKLLAPDRVDPNRVDPPWYPADVRESAIGGLAELFTSRDDNWLFPFSRSPQGHSMDFVLRPGERLTRYYGPETETAFYLPYHFDGARWQEFPREIAQYRIRTKDGPRSQKDSRFWGTGRIEYRPPLWNRGSYYSGARLPFNDNIRIPASRPREESLCRELPDRPGHATFELRSPYVLIDADITLSAALAGPLQLLEIEISMDGGRRWEKIGSRHGPFTGEWNVAPQSRVRSAHGALSPVAGSYAYLIRLRLSGPGPVDSARVNDVHIASRFQLNPRTLPELRAGRNELVYSAGDAESRQEIVPALERIADFASEQRNLRCVTESGQSFLWPETTAPAWVVFELEARDGAELAGFDAGARFLDLRDGLAPDKLTAEVRRTPFAPASRTTARAPRGALSWSTAPEGPFTPLWEYDTDPKWKDGKPVRQLLRWPEVDRPVRELPRGTRRVYVRYSISEMGLDSLRLAAISREGAGRSALEITHQWLADGVLREHVERIDNPGVRHGYVVDTGNPARLSNHATIFYCPR